MKPTLITVLFAMSCVSVAIAGPPVRSKLRYKEDLLKGIYPRVDFDLAGVATPDPVAECPVQSVHDSAKSDACSVLSRRLESARAQIQKSLSSQILSDSDVAQSADQDKINEATQRSMAITEILGTTSDLLSGECIHGADNRVAIQRLMGQVLTISGLIVGQWPGIIMAGGGQFFGSLPIFSADIQRDIRSLSAYSERAARASFLCVHRQLLKTSCTLFSEPRDRVIGGIDLDYRSGATRTTLESLRRIEAERKRRLDEIRFLKAAAGLELAETRQAELLREKLAAFCLRPEWAALDRAGSFTDEAVFPKGIRRNVLALDSRCEPARRLLPSAGPYRDYLDSLCI